MGVAAYCECAYALARFYIREGLKIAREHKEASRYSYEYNNLAVTYLAQRDYEKALDAIREAEQNLPQSDKKCTPTSTATWPRSAAMWAIWTKPAPR